MRPIKQILLGVVAIAGIFAAAFYSSCSKDECAAKVCITRGSSCQKGICKCPDGVFGANCETEYRTRYSGEYKGYAPDDTLNLYTHKLIFVPVDDTADYNKMELLWIDTGFAQLAPKLNIRLVNHTSSGSGFNFDSLAFGARYSGYGTINAYAASMRLTVRDTSSGQQHTYVFENYLKQQ